MTVRGDWIVFVEMFDLSVLYYCRKEGNAMELTSMRNICKEIARKLNSVDICSAEELKRIGSREAFFRLKTRYTNVCLVFLYSLQGAIDDVEYNRLSEETKRELKAFSDSLK